MKQSLTVIGLTLTVLCAVLKAQTQNLDQRRQSRFETISQAVTDEIPLIIAHRGASGYLPEHTTESTAYAHALGADFIEQDVVLTKDGIPVVLHDVTLNATTDVAEKFPDRCDDGHWHVWDFTLQELRQLSVQERVRDVSRNRFPQNTGQFRIATLDEHLQLIRGLNASRRRKTGIYVEIKSPELHRQAGFDLAAAVLQVLAAHDYTQADDRVFVQCFDEAELLRLRTEFDCRLPLIQLFSSTPTTQQIAATSKVADGIGVRISAVVSDTGDPKKLTVSDIVRTAHHHAMMVHVWTFRTDDLPEFAESPELLLNQLVRDAGVDGVFTDHPDTVLAWRRAAGRDVRLRRPFHLLNSGRPRQ